MGENGIPIGRHHDNPILDTRFYEVECLDVHKELLSTNTIAGYLFSQVGEEGNRFVLFDKIVYHRVNGEDTMQQDAFSISNNGCRRRIKTTKFR